VGVFDRISGFLAWSQVIQPTEHVFPDPISETLLEREGEFLPFFVAAKTVCARTCEKVGAGVHGEFVEQVLQVHGCSVARNACKELLHVGLELLDC
jgi:hypothetical protein